MIGLGVLILTGFVVVVVTLVHRTLSPAASHASTSAAAGAGTIAAIGEPQGSRIVTMVATGDRLALLLSGGGEDRVVLIDPQTGARMATIRLSGPPSLPAH